MDHPGDKLTNRCTVAGCANPAGDAHVCMGCTRDLFADLIAVPWLIDHLAVTLARLDRVLGSLGHTGAAAAAPLPIRWTAVQAAVTLRHTLAPRARRVAAQRGLVCDLADDQTAGFARWLACHLVWVRQCGDAGELVDEVRYAINQARVAVDRPPDLFYAGPCDSCRRDLYCGADQHGHPTASVIRCECGRTYETADRRAWLLDAAYDHLATATEIAQAVPSLYGRRIPVDTIRTWIARGQLLPRAWLHAGRVHTHRQSDRDRPLCRIGDVIDLARRRDEHTEAS
jgi:hypothetical protein